MIPVRLATIGSQSAQLNDYRFQVVCTPQILPRKANHGTRSGKFRDSWQPAFGFCKGTHL